MFSHFKFATRYKYFFICSIFVVCLNIYLLYCLAYDNWKSTQVQEPKVSDVTNGQFGNAEKHIQDTSLIALKKLEVNLNNVSTFFKSFKFSMTYHHNFSNLFLNTSSLPDVDLWDTAAKWVGADQITPNATDILPHVLRALETSKIQSADITSKGTQLKILLTLNGGQKALFKPKWYERDKIIQGKVYAGKDRHNGEIAAFQLARLLGLHRAPIVSGRTINLKEEILPVATYELSRTFYKNGTNTCFYGVCLYCKPTDGICADGDMLEGSITLWLPNTWKLVRIRHPWQRSYNSNPATWEVFNDYCSVIQKSKIYKDNSRLLDLIETSVFDFLIDNGDRHHYEVFEKKLSKVLLIDNGKSFGNPDVDHVDTLAPLYQCCSIREKFVATLAALQDGLLSHFMEILLSSNPLSPVLTKPHLLALDRRLKIVLAGIIGCINQFGAYDVLIVD